MSPDVRRDAYGQAVWFWLPDAGVRFAEYFRGRWWLKSPVHQEEHGAAVKPLRRECRSDFGVPVLACVRLFCFARKAVGAACTRHSLRPLAFSRDENDATLGRSRVARVRDARHCEERSDEAIHCSTSGQVDCFASLAMTGIGCSKTNSGDNAAGAIAHFVATLVLARLCRASGAIYPRGLIDPLGNCPWPGPWIRTYGAHLLS